MVASSATGKHYRSLYGRAANIQELGAVGRPQVGWCVLPRSELVAGDVMLAQKIALETDEASTMAIANRFPTRLVASGRLTG